MMYERGSSKRSREEIALLEKVAKSLDSKFSANPKTKISASAGTAPPPPPPAKDLLATRRLVNAIVKACVKEIDQLVEEYRPQYPSLSKEKVVDGILRYQIHRDSISDQSDKGAENNGDEPKFGPCAEIVEAEMSKHHAKIDAIKNSRKEAAASKSSEDEKDRLGEKRKALPDVGHGSIIIEITQPSRAVKLGIGLEGREGEPMTISSIAPDGLLARHLELSGMNSKALVGMKVDSINGSNWTSASRAIASMRVSRVITIMASVFDFQYPEVHDALVRRGGGQQVKYRARGKQGTPEHHLIEEIFRSYAADKVKYGDCLPRGHLAKLVKETKKKLNLESVDLSTIGLTDKLNYKWRRLRDKDEEVRKAASMSNLIADQVYERCEQIRVQINGERLEDGTIRSLIDAAKIEQGVTGEFSFHAILKRINKRYRMEHPEAEVSGKVPIDYQYPEVCDQPVRRGRGETVKYRKRKGPGTPEHYLIDKIFEKYCVEKEKYAGKLPMGCLANLVDETKLELHMESVDLTGMDLQGKLNYKWKRFRNGQDAES